MEIVTWVLSGRLEHKDSEGNHGEIYPGLAQRMSAGTGIWHSEMNPSAGEDVHFVQMWVLPDTEAVDPGYEQSTSTPSSTAVGSCRSRRVRATTPPSRSASAMRCSGADGSARARRSSVPDAAHAHLYVAGRRRRARGRRQRSARATPSG